MLQGPKVSSAQEFDINNRVNKINHISSTHEAMLDLNFLQAYLLHMHPPSMPNQLPLPNSYLQYSCFMHKMLTFCKT